MRQTHFLESAHVHIFVLAGRSFRWDEGSGGKPWSNTQGKRQLANWFDLHLCAMSQQWLHRSTCSGLLHSHTKLLHVGFIGILEGSFMDFQPGDRCQEWQSHCASQLSFAGRIGCLGDTVPQCDLVLMFRVILYRYRISHHISMNGAYQFLRTSW